MTRFECPHSSGTAPSSPHLRQLGLLQWGTTGGVAYTWQKLLLSRSGRWKVQSQCLGMAPSWCTEGGFSLCPREDALWRPFYKSTNPVHEESSLMTSLPHGAPPPNTITLGVRVQHRTSGETQMFRPSHCPPPAIQLRYAVLPNVWSPCK